MQDNTKMDIMKKWFWLCGLLFSIQLQAQHRQLISGYQPNDSIILSDLANKSKKSYIIEDIEFTGNKITKDFIISRELTFKKGDTISSDKLYYKLELSQQNLLKTSLFNFVDITDSVIRQDEFVHLKIQFRFIERWYLWPVPIFEISDRNFNTWWEEKNFDRISYGIFLNKENNRGRMESLRMLIRVGYDERYEVSYNIPYINKKQTFGAAIGTGWIQNREVPFQTQDNKQLFIRLDDQYIYKNFYTYLLFTHRPNHVHQHLLQLKYNYFVFSDTILTLNPEYSFKSETRNEYLSFNYQFTSDQRDSKPYPLQGSYFTGQLIKSGLGILKNDDLGMMELTGSYRKYWKLPKKLYFSTDWTGKISTNRNQPYFYETGLGFDRNFVRGYELYVIDGQSFILSKNAIKYAVITPKTGNIRFIKSEKFGKIHYALYANAFFDVGYVDDFRNYDEDDLSNQLLLGGGFGLDLVTYYDIVFRVEASVNKRGETGIFIHLKNTL